MTIESINPFLAAIGQWIYATGSDFDQENISIYFGDVQCFLFYVSSPSIVAMSVPSNCPDECNIRIVKNSEETISSTMFNLLKISSPPTINCFFIDEPNQWVHIHGENFIWGDTTLTLGDTSVSSSVIEPKLCGFRYSESLDLKSITVQTKFGSFTYST